MRGAYTASIHAASTMNPRQARERAWRIAGDYLQVIRLTATAVALALPLYCYRNRIVSWLRGRSPR